jgi:amino acid adenylation domain-containing protein/non-ribosomal peptide synthase protein (TIGR01720 family)
MSEHKTTSDVAQLRSRLEQGHEIDRAQLLALIDAIEQEIRGAPTTDHRAGREVEPTPIMLWLRDQGAVHKDFYQSALLTLPRDTEQDQVEAALAYVIRRHDALRMRLIVKPEGWKLAVQPRHDVDASRVLASVNEGESTTRGPIDIGLDPEGGVMLRAFFQPAVDGPTVQLFVHHLAVDAVSWRTICRDFYRALAEARLGEYADEGDDGVIERWSAYLWGERQSRAERSEADYWLHTLDPPGPLIPAIDPAPPCSVAANGRTTATTLSPQVTERILGAVSVKRDVHTEEFLLIALALAAIRWRRLRDPQTSAITIDVETHGRIADESRLNVSESVGWFTAQYPLKLALPSDCDDGIPTSSQALWRLFRQLKQQIRQVPEDGLGFGLLRYGPGPTAAALGQLPSPQIGFNYLGTIAAPITANASPPFSLGGSLDPRMRLPHPLDVSASVARDPDGSRLRMSWTYDPALLSEADVEEFVETFTGYVTGLASEIDRPWATVRTPQDLLFVKVSSDELEHLEFSYPDFEDIYPAVPLQEGFLFHSSTESVDPYLTQLVLEAEESVHVGRLQNALDCVLQRHAALRVSFQRLAGGRLVQVVCARATCRVAEVTSDANSDLTPFLQRDRVVPFDAAQAPLMRVTLIHLEGGRSAILWTLHHAIIDGWSMPIVLHDLRLFYSGSAEDLFPAPSLRRYFDWLQQRDLDAANDAWRSIFTTPERSSFLFQSRKPGEVTTPDHLDVELDSDATSAVVSRAREDGVTLNAVLQAAWGLLLSRLSGDAAVCFGTTVSGRQPDVSGAEMMVGLFINTVPAFVRIDPSHSARALIRRVHDDHAAMIPHQFQGLTAIQQALGTESLFDTLLVFENYPRETSPSRRSGSDWRPTRGTAGSHYALAIVAFFDGARLRLRFEFLAPVCSRTRATRIADRLLDVLAVIAQEPDRLLGGIDVGGHQLPVSVERPLQPRDRTSASLFLRLVEVSRLAPDAVAVVDGVSTVSYGVLLELAERVATALYAKGVRRGDVIGISLPRSIEMIAVMIGIVRIGAAYMPLDPSYPVERLEFMCREATVGLIIYDSPESRWATDCEFVNVDALLATHVEERPPVINSRLLPAYVMYTSGSTGRPKGVVVTCGSILDLVLNTNYIHLAGEDCTAYAASVCFDATTFEVWAPLLTGSSIAIVDSDTLLSPHDLSRQLEANHVTVMFLTTALFNQLVREGMPALSSLRWLLFGGESVDAQSVRLLMNGKPPVHVRHVYGPTETTTFATAFPVTAMSNDETTVPIGQAIAGTETSVLDVALWPVGEEETGELYISGSGVAQGYLQDPSATACRFVADPNGPRGMRMYRTGDFVRCRDDGQLEFVGRSDNQVKVRGFRISPSEIEACLLQVAAVAQAIVCVCQENNERRLVAYVVAEKTAGMLQVASLRAHLSDRLPHYMVPSTITVLDALPLTATGKVDRARLPSPQPLAMAYASPVTDGEKLVADSFASVLGLETVSRDDDFFLIGGDSLRVMRMVSCMRDAGLHIRPQDVFRHRTVRNIAAAVRKSDAKADECRLFDRVLRFQTAGDQRPLFCLPPASGIGWPFAKMVDAISSRRPLYALQAPGLDEASPLPSSVEEYAASYLREIRRIQPSGPYCLAGWSFGGLCAHAIGCMLLDAGATIEAVVIVDAYPDAAVRRHLSDRSFAPEVVDIELLSHGLGHLAKRELRGIRLTIDHCQRIASDFIPRVFGGDVLLVSCAGNEPLRAAWRPHVRGRIAAAEIPFTHQQLTQLSALTLTGELIEDHISHQLGGNCNDEPVR